VNAKPNKNRVDFQHNNLKRMGLQFLLLILVSVTAYNYFSGAYFNKPIFPINTIQVVGELENTKQQALQSVMLEYLDSGFFVVDVAAIKMAVEKLEWIETASVRRVWPDKIRVLVTEQKAVAQWGDVALINKNGLLFSPEKMSYPGQLVSFKGPDAMRIDLLEFYQELQAMLQEYDLQISKVEVNSRRALEVSLSNGMKLIFGKQRDVGESSVLVHRFLIACKQGLANRLDDIAVIDLRYTNGFSVRWKEKEKMNVSSKRVSVNG
jgi:cell division protein FtsQ